MINCEIDVKSMRNALDIVIDVVTKKNKNLLYEYVEPVSYTHLTLPTTERV